ncbi:MAG: putative CRISPR-associated protein [Spirulina sp. DLM2.Bin59]|nr:MAG: putative CRISPR-associated protein [Spirulina sp. DLM2.Bin59]
MQNRLFILSPCGTSLLNNQANNAERKLVNQYANTKQPEQISPEDKAQLQSLAERVKHKLVSADLDLASQMSAELNGIIKLYNGQISNSHDYHVLLCTDTWLGETTATFVSEWLKAKGHTVQINRQTDLQTKDINSFQIALSEIVTWCEENLTNYRNSGYKIIFNLTGGFKSVQGFLQTLATFYADETIYIFETSKDLLRIPRLPVEMAAEETVRQNLETFRRLSIELPISKKPNIPETLLINIDGQIGLSPWGDLVWKQTKRKIYSNSLHPSPSKQLTFGSKFEYSVKGISADRLILVNERIDQLSKNLETKGQYNPPSLDLKTLKGNPCPPSTHEIDAWADQDAKRIFGHYDNNCFVLDKLDRALH